MAARRKRLEIEMGVASPTLSRKEAAKYLTQLGYPITPKTLANLASNNNQGCGPPFLRRGWKAVFYERAELLAWAKSRYTKVATPTRYVPA
jgi:hypothetical protein